MPASITLSSLNFALPDGRVLFSNLNFSFNQERTGHVGRNGVGKSTLLRLISGELAPSAGHVSVSGRLGVLRQGFAPEAGETVADQFSLRGALATLRRAEAGVADAWQEADWTLGARFAEALGRAGLDISPETPLASLSGGQRTRAALAALVFAEPDFLLLDEPTNHLDIASLEAVEAGLSAYDGALLVVSHDEAFLERISVARRIELRSGRLSQS